MLFVLFVSYAGSRGHRPRWIALGCVLMAVGSIVFIIPHFIANQYDYRAVGKCGTNVLGTELSFSLFWWIKLPNRVVGNSMVF